MEEARCDQDYVFARVDKKKKKKKKKKIVADEDSDCDWEPRRISSRKRPIDQGEQGSPPRKKRRTVEMMGSVCMFFLGLFLFHVDSHPN
jgi:hypothetical protein